MPATAGRVRMPANNRVHSSAALQTHGIWQSAIGYDPYAPDDSSKSKSSGKPDTEGGAENAYASFQGLLALARITGTSSNDTRGACKKCGRVGHLTYQCRNFLSVKEDKEKDGEAVQNATAVFDKIKKANGAKEEGEESSAEEEEEESESSDSDVDSEIERIIAARKGKKANRKKTEEIEGSKDKEESIENSKKRRRRRSRNSSDDGDEEEEERNEKRKHHHHHRKSRKDKKRSHRRRHHSYDDSEEDSDRHHGRRKQRSRRKEASDSETDSSSSDHQSSSRKKRHLGGSRPDGGKNRSKRHK